MWPSSVEDNNKRVCYSSSNSSSSSSSSVPFSTSSHLSNPRRKTMEEVWKDINLAALHDHPTREVHNTLPNKNNHNTFNSGMILQDFLARPFDAKDPSTSVVSIEPTAARSVRIFDSPPPPPATILNLNSGPEFSAATDSYISSLTTPFDAFPSSPGLIPFCQKRVPETDDNSGDRRHKRMIKNRESAARSRARKQAYTNELEIAVDQLIKENNKLKEQQQQLHLAAAQLPKKHMLYRTSTAPF